MQPDFAERFSNTTLTRKGMYLFKIVNTFVYVSELLMPLTLLTQKYPAKYQTIYS